LRLHLWQKCLKGGEARAARDGRVALLLHGATWSGRPDFDLSVRDYSLMDFLARNGYDVWALDIHGYGSSDRTTRDWSDAASAAADVESALDYIRTRRGVSRVKVLGWSWGTQVAGIHAAAHPDHVSRLILYAPVWKGRDEWRDMALPDEQYRENMGMDAREGFIPGLYEDDAVEECARLALETDPRSPNGALVDLASRLPLVDPGRITVPTLVIRPEHDFASAREEMTAFHELLGCQDKRLLHLPGGGHNMILEKGHRTIQSAILDFFEGR
jgi:pimeloyl-ACP methyl ester carboxylesterase